MVRKPVKRSYLCTITQGSEEVFNLVMRMSENVAHIASPVFNIFTTSVVATGAPVVVANVEEFDATGFDIAMEK